jgi:hypothetical protein
MTKVAKKTGFVKKAYVVKTYSIRNRSIEAFEKKFNELCRHAEKIGAKQPVKADLASRLFDMATAVDAKVFFENK